MTFEKCGTENESYLQKGTIKNVWSNGNLVRISVPPLKWIR